MEKQTVSFVKRALFVLVALLAVGAITGCATMFGGGSPEVTSAIATIRSVQGSAVTGTISFVREQEKIRVVVDVRGLPPGKHGLHIHEYGDLSAPDAGSVGGHLNPNAQPHGGPTDQKRHLGDLGNIEADRNGSARASFLIDRIALSGPNSIIGRSIVVKERFDDFRTQPAGAAGARIAWGIIGIASSPVE